MKACLISPLMTCALRLWLSASLMGCISTANAQAPPSGGDLPVQLSTYWSKTGAEPGQAINLAIVADIPNHFHMNVNTATGDFVPTTVEVRTLPDHVQASTALFPPGHEIIFGDPPGDKIKVFSGRTIFYVPMVLTAESVPGRYPVEVEVSYQLCDNRQCFFPTQNTVRTELVVLEAGQESKELNPEIFAPMAKLKPALSIPFFGWDFSIDPTNLWLLLLVAAIGGLLLNFTPCVLPLIPIKMMSLAQAAGNRRRCLMLGAAMSAGVVAFWLGLAFLISGLRGISATNELFQYPLFTIGVGLVICVMAIGMCGFFVIRLPQWIYRFNPGKESLIGSVLFGVMTAVLSTPCTAPFMGAAAAWATTRATIVTLATFGAIGAGMALPYFLLSAWPRLVHRMPRTGPAGDLIKQVMGLLMLAAGAYFLGTGVAGWLATPPDPPTRLYWWAVATLVIAAGLWLAWRTLRVTSKTLSRFLFGGLGLALAVTGGAIGRGLSKGSPIHWIYYTPERLAAAQTAGKMVVLEFTAAWCLNCVALEKGVLHRPQIVSLMNSDRVIPIKIDLTGKNVAGNRKLTEVGRRTIPYLLVLNEQGQQVFASDAYTVDQLRSVLGDGTSK